MPALSSRCIQNLKGHCEQPSVSSDGLRSYRFDISRRNSILDPLVYHSPLTTMAESSNLTKGIKGVTICKQVNDDRSMTTSKGITQNKSKNRLPRLHINDHRRWKYHQDNMRIKITINNGSNKKHGSGRRVDPLDCFKISSLSRKSNK